MVWETKAKAFYFEGQGHRGLYAVSIPLFFDTPQSSEEQILDKKGNNILDKEVDHKLSRGTQF